MEINVMEYLASKRLNKYSKKDFTTAARDYYAKSLLDKSWAAMCVEFPTPAYIHYKDVLKTKSTRSGKLHDVKLWSVTDALNTNQCTSNVIKIHIMSVKSTGDDYFNITFTIDGSRKWYLAPNVPKKKFDPWFQYWMETDEKFISTNNS